MKYLLANEKDLFGSLNGTEAQKLLTTNESFQSRSGVQHLAWYSLEQCQSEVFLCNIPHRRLANADFCCYLTSVTVCAWLIFLRKY